MAPKDLTELLHRRPFRPIRVHVSNSRTFDIVHPDFALVGLSTVWIYSPKSPEPEDGFDYPIGVTLRQIVMVEFLRPETKASLHGGA